MELSRSAFRGIMAETFTEKLKLSKRDTGDLNWGQSANSNLEAIDAYVQQSFLRPPRTLTSTLSSGSVGPNLTGNTTYYYKITAVNDSGETTEGRIPNIVEAQVTQPQVPLPVILQWEPVKGAVGYRIYKSNIPNTEKLLSYVSGENTSVFTDDGNTETSNTPVPLINTAHISVSKISSGVGISLTPEHGRGDVTINNLGVRSIKKLGESNSLTGEVSLEPGSNIEIIQDINANKITINSLSGGSGGNFIKVAETVLASDNSSFGIISPLDLDIDKCYKLFIDFSLADNVTSSVKSIYLILNGSTSNYNAQFITLGFGGSSPTANPQSSPVIAFIQTRVSNYPDSVISEVLIRKDGRNRILALSQSIGNLNYSYSPNLSFGGYLWGGGTNVNSIEVKTADGTNFKSGSKLVLYKLT